MSHSKHQLYYQILVPPLAQALTYCSSSEPESPQIGHKVLVPLGRRKASGFVIEVSSTPAKSAREYQIKSILDPLSSLPCFNQEQLDFFNWVAEYYGEPLSQVLDVAVPASTPPKAERLVTLSDYKFDQNSLRAKKQKQILTLLKEAGGALPLAKLKSSVGAPTQALKKLCQLGVLNLSDKPTLPGSNWSTPAPAWAKTDVRLNPDQIAALNKIQLSLKQRKFSPYLMHGITGSGKTEVYIEAIAQAQSLGLGALVIVPEIALTPQLVDRFRARLGDRISVLHSALSKRERWEAWSALIQQQHSIAIGTRSAVFAPIKSLGLIVVDEEHDQSLKQSEGLRYNARDLAIMRAKFQSCPVVLGSATPSLESYSNAMSGKYDLLDLPTRPSSSSTLKLEIVDMNRLKPWDLPSRNISPILHQAMEETLLRGEQVFIMYNRRGFASYLQCQSCEHVVVCPNCSVSLTYHQSQNSLVCHYCSLSSVAPLYCPACSPKSADPEQSKLQQRGAGTEKIFEELQALFPEVKVARLDRDSAGDHEHYKKILDSVRSAETQILVGTQMIAKGHDLPLVTLVGVADCDVGLHLPDFRSAERSFQLLTQVAGRAGRADKPGRVILQTRVPNHPALVHTLSHDFHAFAEGELKARRSLDYPPYAKLLRIVASALDDKTPEQSLIRIKAYISRVATKLELKLQVLGPAPAPLAKIKARYRSHLLIKSKSSSQLNIIVRELKAALKKETRVRIAFDLDPQDML